jgi:hypothetical protein
MYAALQAASLLKHMLNHLNWSRPANPQSARITSVCWLLCRCPGLAFAASLAVKLQQGPGAASGPPQLSRSFYLLNPDGDLPETQDTFQDQLKQLCCEVSGLITLRCLTVALPCCCFTCASPCWHIVLDTHLVWYGPSMYELV